MSKTYGLAGLRIGWLATRNQAVMQALQAYKDYTSICNSAPSEFLSVIALKHHAEIAARNLAIIRRNLDTLDSFFARYPDVFNWQRPVACSIAFPCLKLDTPIDTFCEDLAQRKGVMLLPGTVYEPDLQNFRIGFGRANLPACLDHLDAYLRQ
jgi:aspartate/methionine/tyrosine aminotransferase